MCNEGKGPEILAQCLKFVPICIHVLKPPLTVSRLISTISTKLSLSTFLLEALQKENQLNLMYSAHQLKTQVNCSLHSLLFFLL